MANKLISQMNLLSSLSHVFSAHNLLTAEDALSLPELDLISLLELDISLVRSAISLISESTSPPFQTALSPMEERSKSPSHLATSLQGLDDVLSGGIPFGALTELVAPSGIGKTQISMHFVSNPVEISSRRLLKHRCTGKKLATFLFITKGISTTMKRVVATTTVICRMMQNDVLFCLSSVVATTTAIIGGLLLYALQLSLVANCKVSRVM